MTSLNTQLWELISNHKMPDEASGRSFTQQLMDEHGITRATASVAVTEYRKFMYLCATRAERNVPSKAVDLVWHLHMQHSRDYWDVFCKKLGKPVHHNPGGADEGHLNDYRATVAVYKTLFGAPPKGIWRHSGPVEKIMTLFVPVGITCVGVGSLVGEDAAVFSGLFALAIGLISFVTAINGMTARSEFTLVFENDDPFANDDAGDCSSGCGGCGD